jgi:hypothetical protein
MSVTHHRQNPIVYSTEYWLDDGGIGVRVPVKLRIFSSLRRPYRLWGPANFLSNEYWGLFLREESGRSVKVTTHTSVEIKKNVDLYIHSHIRVFMAYCLIKLSTGTTLP